MRQWVPDELWALAQPLIPPQRARPQGGGTAMVDPQAVLAAIVYVLCTGWAWRHLPPGFGKATVHRRFEAWTRAGLWRRLHRAVLDELGAQGQVDWTQALLDTASVRTKKEAA